MEQFTGFNGPHVAGANGDQRDRPSAAVNKFDLVSPALVVNMHDGPHVSTVEFLVGRVAIQNDKRMFGYHRSSSGYAVTSQ